MSATVAIRIALDYMHARYYSARMGRFLSVDPRWVSVDLSRPQTWNRYSYVLNNSVRYTDSDGRCTVAVIDCVVEGGSLGGLAGALIGLGVGLGIVGGSQVDVAGKPIGTHIMEFMLSGGGSSGEMAAETMINSFSRQQAAKLDHSPMQSRERNPKQDKMLALVISRSCRMPAHDVHELKGGENASTYDLYKDKRETST